MRKKRKLHDIFFLLLEIEIYLSVFWITIKNRFANGIWERSSYYVLFRKAEKKACLFILRSTLVLFQKKYFRQD